MFIIDGRATRIAFFMWSHKGHLLGPRQLANALLRGRFRVKLMLRRQDLIASDRLCNRLRLRASGSADAVERWGEIEAGGLHLRAHAQARRVAAAGRSGSG
jgi:hypothetical protein